MKNNVDSNFYNNDKKTIDKNKSKLYENDFKIFCLNIWFK